MKTNLLQKFLSSFFQVGALVLALICISTQAHAGPVLAAVGPDTPDPDDHPITCGYLEVFSATERSDSINNEDVNFNPHSAYWIYDTTGKRIKTVQNHGTSPEEGPATVELKPGTYTVRAYADNKGLVTVPVIIKLARTTSVHLDRGN
jgi:hypothetical protein